MRDSQSVVNSYDRPTKIQASFSRIPLMRKSRDGPMHAGQGPAGHAAAPSARSPPAARLSLPFFRSFSFEIFMGSRDHEPHVLHFPA